MIRQRIKACLKRAVAQGVKLGRPKIDSKLAVKIQASLDAGISIRNTADRYRVGISTVQRIKAAADPRIA